MSRTLQSQLDLQVRAQWRWITATVVMVGLFYIGCYRPQTLRLRSLLNQISKAQTQLDTGIGRTARGANGSAQNSLQMTRCLELGRFVTSLADLSKHSALNDLQYSLVGPAHPYSRYWAQDMTLKFSGDFQDVFEFLRQLEYLPPPLRLQNVTVHDAGRRDGVVNAELSISLFYTGDQ